MKKEVLEVLKNRRSIRKYKPDLIEGDVLDAVLEAGTYAPTAAGTQAPVIVAVQDADTIAKLNEINAKILNMDNMKQPYYGAPTILLVFAPMDGHTPTEDGTLVAGNLLNAACAMDIGTCWIHRSQQMFETPEGKGFMKSWGVPEDMKAIASIAAGYPDCSLPKAAPRKDGYIIKV